MLYTAVTTPRLEPSERAWFLDALEAPPRWSYGRSPIDDAIKETGLDVVSFETKSPKYSEALMAVDPTEIAEQLCRVAQMRRARGELEQLLGTSWYDAGSPGRIGSFTSSWARSRQQRGCYGSRPPAPERAPTATTFRNARDLPPSAGGRGRCIHLTLDGWPLLLVRLDVGLIAVNDLRNGAMYSHVAAVGSIGDDEELRIGAVGNELYLLVGEVATVFVTPEDGRSGHAEVAVVASATGRLLLERTVRYRQVRLPSDSCGMANGGRRALAPYAPPTTF